MENKTQATYAAKRFLKENVDSIQSFETEFLILRGLQHPNIVQMIGYFENDTSIYIVMNLMDGSLKGRIQYKKENGLSWWTSEELEGYVLQIVEGLIYLKQCGVSHRDLKVL